MAVRVDCYGGVSVPGECLYILDRHAVVQQVADKGMAGGVRGFVEFCHERTAFGACPFFWLFLVANGALGASAGDMVTVGACPVVGASVATMGAFTGVFLPDDLPCFCEVMITQRSTGPCGEYLSFCVLGWSQSF